MRSKWPVSLGKRPRGMVASPDGQLIYVACGSPYSPPDVDESTLPPPDKNAERHRDLIVRVAGYSDYFCDLTTPLQDEIIAGPSTDRSEASRLLRWRAAE